jgi:uncharacterized protein
MLLQFSVSNFRSFKDEQFITMIPAKVKGHGGNIAHVASGLDVLRSAVIYGANASGKSNFVKALGALKSLVLSSSDNKPGEPFKEYEPFKLTRTSENTPTCFKIDVLIKSVQYHYEVSFTHHEVKHEKLTYYPQGREARLFERKYQEFSFGQYFRGPKKYLQQITAPNQLFLSKAATNNVEELAKVSLFFSTKFSAISLSGDILDKALNMTTTVTLANDNSGFAKKIRKLFSILDTGIRDFQIQDVHPEMQTPNFSKYKVKTVHSLPEEGGDALFDLEDESTGTQKLFWMAGLILSMLEEGGIFILDELERSLHPHISRFIISLFNDPKINKNNAQLIASTHDVTLLSEENKLRRDQIWIVEKNEQGASELFSLADMKGVRDNVPFEKWYLSGRFGGVPNIESLQLEFDYFDEKKENKTNGKKD